MATTRVVHCKLEPYDVLIDRTTEWGNPFSDGTREENVARFEELIRECFKRDPALKVRARACLSGRVLGCWCKTRRDPDRLCHGDTWIKLINENCDNIEDGRANDAA